MVSVKILYLDNELSVEKILNTNAPWLSKNITKIGENINHVTVIGDTVKEISSASNEAFAQIPNLCPNYENLQDSLFAGE